MHWPSFLVGLLVLPVFVLVAGLTQSVLQSLKRRRKNVVGTLSTTPLARGAEPLEFTSRLVGGIGQSRPLTRRERAARAHGSGDAS